MEQNPLIEEFRLARPMTVKAMTGTLTLTPEHLAGAVACFDHMVAAALEAGGVPAYPVAKIDHIDTPNTPVVGEFRKLRVDPVTGWLMGALQWRDAETMQWGHDRGLSRCSIEIDFDQEVYGKTFASRLVDVALLPAEQVPAMPGAGSMRAVAAAPTAGIRVRLTCGTEDEPDGARAGADTDNNGTESEMDEKLAAVLQQLTEGIATIGAGLTALTAKIDAMTAKETAAEEAATAAATEAAAAANTASLAEFGAKLAAATTAGKVTQGEAEELTEVAQALPIEGRAKLAASLEKRPVIGTPPEKMPDGKAKLTADERAAEAQKLVRAKLAADPTNYTAAVLAAKKERPELFEAAEEVK